MTVKVWLHRHGLRYSPSTDLLYEQGSLFRAGASRWEGFLGELAGTWLRKRGEALQAVGWEWCSTTAAWDFSHQSEPEPERWMGFTCPEHIEHEFHPGADGKLEYLGKRGAWVWDENAAP